MPSGVIHKPKNTWAALWRRYRAALLDAGETGTKTRCPWCEGAGVLYDGKSGLVVYCDCCNRTGFIPDDHGVPALDPSNSEPHPEGLA